MDFDKIVEKRKSVRNFKNKRPAWDKILEAIDMANQGPFAGNNNNLKFLIIENSQMIQKIAESSNQLWMNESQLLIVVVSSDNELKSIYGERGIDYSRQQAGSSIMTLLLKLTEQEIDSCWVGAYDEKEIKRLLKIDSKYNVEAIITTGYENKKIEKKKKKSLDTTVYWETWENSKRPTFFEDPKDPHDIRTAYS